MKVNFLAEVQSLASKALTDFRDVYSYARRIVDIAQADGKYFDDDKARVLMASSLASDILEAVDKYVVG